MNEYHCNIGKVECVCSITDYESVMHDCKKVKNILKVNVGRKKLRKTAKKNWTKLLWKYINNK